MRKYPKPTGRRLDNVKSIDRELQRRAGRKPTKHTVRKTRYLISHHDFPVVRSGRLIWSFTCWIDLWEAGKLGRGDGDHDEASSDQGDRVETGGDPDFLRRKLSAAILAADNATAARLTRQLARPLGLELTDPA
jgi:hypothetical protein